MGVLNSIFGSKPTVPKFNPVDINLIEGKTIKDNQANLFGAEALAGGVNTFNQQQLTKMVSDAIPGLTGIENAVSGNIQSLLKGEIPQDVQDQIQRSAAGKQLGGGYAGSAMGRDLLGRDLGITSLQLTEKGFEESGKWLSTVRNTLTPELMSPSAMFFSPQQQLSHAVEERNAAMSQQWMQDQVNAMPDPVAGGIEGRIYGLANAYLGGMGGSAVPQGSSTKGFSQMNLGGGESSGGSEWGIGGGYEAESMGTDWSGGGSGAPMSSSSDFSNPNSDY